MDLLDSLRALSRRWVITLPLLVLTLASVVAAYVLLPATYESKASVVLLSSEIGSKEAGGNPYLAFDSSLSVTADVVARRMMDEDTVRAFQARGFTAEYKIAISPESDRPILEVDVSGHNRSVTQATLEAVVKQIGPTLDAIQAKSQLNARIRLSDVSKMTAPDETVSGKLRTMIMALACGLIVTVAVPLFVDSAIARRRPAGPGSRPARRPQPARESSAPLAAKAWPVRTEEEKPWEPYLPPETRRGPSDVRNGSYEPRRGAKAPDPRNP
jgi:capsular polysaccharide biosynthesis protein